jgi:hypothetical protein
MDFLDKPFVTQINMKSPPLIESEAHYRIRKSKP